MTFAPTPDLPFTPLVSKVTALVLNKWRADIAASLDTIQGGDYINVNVIRFLADTAGWEFGGGVKIIAGALDVLATAAAIFRSDVSFKADIKVDGTAELPTVIGTTATINVVNAPTLNSQAVNTTTMSATGSVIASGAQGVALQGGQPAPSADPGANNLALGVNQCKAWLQFSTNGSGGVTVDDGFNVGSVALATDGFGSYMQVSFARPMANVNYAVLATPSVPNDLIVVRTANKIASGFRVYVYNPAATATPQVLTAGSHTGWLAVWGRQ